MTFWKSGPPENQLEKLSRQQAVDIQKAQAEAQKMAMYRGLAQASQGVLGSNLNAVGNWYPGQQPQTGVWATTPIPQGYNIHLPPNPTAGTKIIVEFDGRKWTERLVKGQTDTTASAFTLEELEQARELITALTEKQNV